MKFFLRLSSLIDRLNTVVGKSVTWLTLIVVLVSAINAVVRKVYGISSNQWLELQWYLFGAIFLLAAGYTFFVNEHVRVDALAERFAPRVQVWIDIIGVIFFLLPATLLIFWLSIPFFEQSYVLNEQSSNTGGLVRWPVKLLIPVGFALLALAGVSHLIKCIGFLRGVCPNPLLRNGGLSAEEELAQEIRQIAQANEATTSVSKGQ
ncbi:TRAP transporter small permease subunit [Alcaligenes faecalis]|uniref:TRAP transporter small permease subunit n=1 Tax=Alcaligenes faecalis TaxID=511 RepID=UPI000F0B43AF|nr:TRAP transporter small permease subunit [Alcaligenes faecalis]AYR19638.1 TRAP transporter small permease subunit [Alcaligenes faecalis]